MAAKRGINARLNYKVDGQGGAGAWLELAVVREVTPTDEEEQVEVWSRLNPNWKQFLMGQRNVSLDFDILWDTSRADFCAVRTARDNKALLGLQILDEADGQGIQADFYVAKFARPETRSDPLTASVTVVLAETATPPTAVGY